MNDILVNIDPVIFGLGPIQIRWYGLMYVVGFVIGSYLLKKICREGLFKIPEKKVDTFITYLIIGMLLGARLTYAFIYNWEETIRDPLGIFAVWRGGLSFHGALIGLLGASIIFARKQKLHFLEVWDALAMAGPQGLFFGRLGNFINGELYGRVTDSFMGMRFAHGGPYPRHPSQLYEAFAEGIVLFLLLFFLRKKVKHHGVLSSLFLLGYGVGRFVVEFYREADAQMGYYFGFMTMGQILCSLMIIAGIALWVWVNKIRIPIAANCS